MKLIDFTIGVGLFICSTLSTAFERSDGMTVRCEVERNGQSHVVEEIWLGHGDQGDRHPELGGAAAVVRRNASGWPVIYFDSVVFKGMLELGLKIDDVHLFDLQQPDRLKQFVASVERAEVVQELLVVELAALFG